MATPTALAVDLGTANVRVVAHGRLVRDEPSIVAVDDRDRTVAVGHAAKALRGRQERDLRVREPLDKGVVVDPAACERLLAGVLRGVPVRRWDRVVVTVPFDCTEVERDAALNAVSTALPHRKVVVLQEPMAAAVGAGLPVHEPRGSVLVDVGHGVTETVVLSLGGVVSSSSIRVGAADFNAAITHSLQCGAELEIGPLTAERLQRSVAAVGPSSPDRQAAVVGRDVRTGLPRQHVVTTEQLASALEAPVAEILESVTAAVADLPAEVAADVAADGVVLTGGGSLLPGLADTLAAGTGLRFTYAPDPLGSVVTGSARAWDATHRLAAV